MNLTEQLQAVLGRGISDCISRLAERRSRHPNALSGRNVASAMVRCVFEQPCESLKLIGAAIGALYRPKGAQT